MKKRKGQMRFCSILMMAVLLLSGCGGSSKSEMAMEAPAAMEEALEYEYATDDIYMDTMPEEEAMEEAAAEEGAQTSAPEVKAESRKLIKTVNMNVETETFDTLMETVRTKTEGMGGYVESSNVFNGSQYYGKNNRNASLTLRIPVEKLDEFLSTVSENTNVISRDENVKDVTLQYVDMKSRKDALETEHDRLLTLLEQAETVEDIITIEGRLSEVRYQMESMESQLRTLENQVSYSTVYLYIEEVVKYTPVKELGTWEKITTGFSASLYDVGRGIKNFVIDLIINIPYIVVWAIVIVVAVFVIRFIIKFRKKAAVKKEEKRLAKEAKKAEKQAQKNAVQENVTENNKEQ